MRGISARLFSRMMITNKHGMLRRIVGAFLSIITVMSLNGIISTKAADTANRSVPGGFVLTESQKDVKLTDDKEVYLGGFPFGVKLYSDGLIIIGFADVDCAKGSVIPAKEAGMEINDIITKVNGRKITGAEDFIETVEKCDGKKITVNYRRNDKEYECEIKPSISESDGKYKTGMWLRDSTAGIGTVTFVDVKNGVFAGLGHGICDNETGILIPMSSGITSDVRIEGIKKGECGSPGELKGVFEGAKNGILLKNTNNGVFGIFSECEDYLKDKIKLGTTNDIKEGSAKIRCTLNDNVTADFDINISEIHKESNGNKNFIVTVTDKNLIEKTGGIVQGMSGSPIIQNGMLVGAVTHVLINDPTKGYGIFIENMLDAVKGTGEARA